MKKLMLSVSIFLLSAAVVALAGDHAYVALNKCVMCHKGVKKGEILEKWKAGPHAKAYTELASAESKAVYEKLGKAGNPQEDPECLVCHVTGYGEADALVAALDHANGVECQACHGAGADYKSMKIMKDRDTAIANGMNANPKESCVKCHNDKSPTFKGFDVEKAWAEVSHERPE